MLDTDPCRLLVLDKQSRFGTTRHPLLNLTRTTVSSVGICQQIEIFPDLEFPPCYSLETLGLSVGQTMAGSPQDDISVKTELDSGQKRNRPERSSAQHRASIACIQCRTKHSRCDGYMPSCTRCKNDGKVCQYAKSRRGIRDPKKRNMINDEASVTDQDARTESTPSPNPPSIDNPFHSPMCFLDLYYANFHVAHSWLPPKPTYEQLIKENPIEMRFLEATVDYIGSLYSSTDSTPLWERAYGMFQGPLPLTHWSVQALLSLAVASFSEQNDSCPWLFSQARDFALRLGLQHKSYADGQEGIIAESCRRTYWGLYIHEMLLNMRDASGRQLLYLTESNGCPELPCGEREYLEYQAGVSIRQRWCVSYTNSHRNSLFRTYLTNTPLGPISSVSWKYTTTIWRRFSRAGSTWIHLKRRTNVLLHGG